MNFSTRVSRPRRIGAKSIARVVCVAVLGVVALAGCGSTSKPAYCSARASLENSLNGVTSLSPNSDVNTLEAVFTKITDDAKTVVSQAKSDFPSQTSAIKTSVDALTSAVDALKANPSPSHIATVTSAAAHVVSSFRSFVDASKSKCG